MPQRAQAKRDGDAVKSQAIKILMNSFYGVLGTPACRFADPQLANAITGFGREILLWTQRRFRDLGYEVLYGDTDSLFVLSGEDDPDRAEQLARELERRLLDAVGPDRHDEAREVLRIARVSWRLRDDDNLLLGRVESQLLRAVGLGLERLQKAGRLEGEPPVDAELAPIVSSALREPSDERLAIGRTARPTPPTPSSGAAGSPRQLVGQPAGPGFATGHARRRSPAVACRDAATMAIP